MDGSTLGIRDQIREFLFTTFYVADRQTITDEASLLENGIIDSTGVLEVIGFLETQFGIRVEDDEIIPANLDTIAHLVDYVGRKRQ